MSLCPDGMFWCVFEAITGAVLALIVLIVVAAMFGMFDQ
jgi:hypothetical protein